MNVARANQRPLRHRGRSQDPLPGGRQRRAGASCCTAASLGSSADVFRRNLRALGAQGIRAIAFDLPGFGKTDPSDDLSGGYRRKFILKFMDALGLKKAALIGHSSSGNPAVSIALEHPDRVSHVMILGTGSLLPPLEAGGTKVGGREEAAQARLEERMVQQGADARRDARAARSQPVPSRADHRRGIAAAAREQHRPLLRASSSAGTTPAGEDGGGKAAVPLWQRLDRAQAAAAADLRPQRPRPRRGARHAAEAEISAAQPAFRRRLQAPRAVGRRRPVPSAGGAVPRRS